MEYKVSKLVPYEEINRKFASFVNQKMMLRLINSGQSSMSNKQDKLVKQVFDTAYEILVIAKRYNKIDLFNRVVRMTFDITPSAEILKVMKYPEMYSKMIRSHAVFNVKLYDLLHDDGSFPFMCKQLTR